MAGSSDSQEQELCLTWLKRCNMLFVNDKNIITLVYNITFLP